MIFHISIVEDQLAEQKRLIELLDIWQKENGHQITYETFFSGEELLQKEMDYSKTDIFFLDIQLHPNQNSSSLSGMDVAHQIRAKGYNGEIIFLTAFTEYVFQGYDVRAFHYLLKPITTEPLTRCMNAYAQDHLEQCYIFKNNKTTLQIPYNHIISFSSVRHSIDILTTQGLYQQRSSLNNLESYLPESFVRCHRSSIVNMKHIYKIEGNTITLSNGLTLSIGRSYLDEIRKEFTKYALRMKA